MPISFHEQRGTRYFPSRPWYKVILLPRKRPRRLLSHLEKLTIFRTELMVQPPQLWVNVIILCPTVRARRLLTRRGCDFCVCDYLFSILFHKPPHETLQCFAKWANAKLTVTVFRPVNTQGCDVQMNAINQSIINEQYCRIHSRLAQNQYIYNITDDYSEQQINKHTAHAYFSNVHIYL